MRRFFRLFLPNSIQILDSSIGVLRYYHCMNFVYPAFLWALAALSIPVIIHLFNFQRPKKVLFTNVRFLRSVKDATNSARQLKQLLILLMRLLFVACLVLAFAQPFLSPKNTANSAAAGRKERAAVTAYIDNSYSMQSQTENGQALDAAASRLEALVGAYQQNTQFHLLTNDFDGKSQYFVNADKIRERIAEVQFSNNYRDLSTINKRQLSAIEAQAQRNQSHDIFWFSDFQKSTAGDLSQLAFDSAHQYYLMPVQTAQEANVFVDSVWLASPFVKANENNQLSVSVFNAGQKPVQNLPIRLHIDDVQVSTATVNIEPLSRSVVKFTFSINSDAAHQCKILLQDLPIAFDNEYFFVLKGAPRLNITHIYGTETPFVKAVFGNGKLFNFQQFSEKNVRYDALSKTDLIVLDGLKKIDASLATALQQAVKRGQSIAVFPSEKPEVNSYNALLNGLNTTLLQAVKDSVSQTLQTPDVRNPFFEGVFENLPQNTAMPKAKSAIAWSSSGVNLLQYKSGKPFLGMWRKGKSTVYLCAAPLKNTENSFAQHAFFVPVMYRMAIRSLQETEALAFTFQQPSLTVYLNENQVNTNANTVFSLEKDGAKIIPSQRVIGKKLLLELPKTQMEAGYYQLVSNGKAQQILALNYGKAESSMSHYTPDELRKIFATHRNVKVFDTLDKQDVTEEFKAQNIGTPLWKYALMLALGFLLLEVLIIRFWR